LKNYPIFTMLGMKLLFFYIPYLGLHNALKISRKKLVRFYNAHGLLKKIVVRNVRINLSKKSNAPLIQSRNIISVEELSVFYSWISFIIVLLTFAQIMQSNKMRKGGGFLSPIFISISNFIGQLAWNAKIINNSNWNLEFYLFPWSKIWQLFITQFSLCWEWNLLFFFYIKIHKNLLSKKSNAPLIQSRNIFSVEEFSVFYSWNSFIIVLPTFAQIKNIKNLHHSLINTNMTTC
jgi:hypothetical protein